LGDIPILGPCYVKLLSFRAGLLSCLRVPQVCVHVISSRAIDRVIGLSKGLSRGGVTWPLPLEFSSDMLSMAKQKTSSRGNQAGDRRRRSYNQDDWFL
jgi:hypothetical protein